MTSIIAQATPVKRNIMTEKKVNCFQPCELVLVHLVVAAFLVFLTVCQCGWQASSTADGDGMFLSIFLFFLTASWCFRSSFGK
jgi:hypothetical protein